MKASLLALALCAGSITYAQAQPDETGRAGLYETRAQIIMPLRPAARERARGRAGRTQLARAAGLDGVSSPLAAKAREIVGACGSVVISGLRHTRVAGTHRMSLHASGRAVDLRGNPACIYSHLAGWPGGYSTDYGRVLHVHVSLGGREDGIRFAHRHLPRHTRYARR